MNAGILFAARIMMAGIFVWDAWLIIAGWQAAIAYTESFGVPGVLLPGAVLFQGAGGLLLAAGWQTRWLALGFAGYALLTALIFHLQPGNVPELLHFGKNFAIAGGFLVLFVTGPGSWSLDRAGSSRA